MPKKRIAIIGATGYTGSELVRILLHHPNAEIVAITSESRAGEQFSDVHPFFQGLIDHRLISVDDIDEESIDLAFLALPHGVSMDYVKRFKNSPFRIIDLSGDFRLNDPETYEAWYKKDHTYKDGYANAAYGLPELFESEIKDAKLVANPGCFPTGAILALAPMIDQKLIDQRVIIDSKTGTTGAGIKAKTVTHFSNVNDNFKAYGLKSHRHSIEIKEKLESIHEEDLNIQFTPHLLPVDRGILTTAYAQPSGQMNEDLLQKAFKNYYANKPFISMTSAAPAIKDVRATNYCNIFATYDERTNNIIIISVIDNLVKGAAGEAVQNMNIMFGWDETTGLNHIPINP